MMVMTLDVKLELNKQHIELVGFTTSRNMTLPSDSGNCFHSDGEL